MISLQDLPPECLLLLYGLGAIVGPHQSTGYPR